MTIQLKKELLLHGAARHDAMMLDQVVRAQKATDLRAHQDAMMHAHHDATMRERHDATTQAVAVLVLPDPKVGAPKVTDQHVRHDETMLVHHDVTMLVHHDVTMLVRHDAVIDQADHDAMIDQVVHAQRATVLHVHHDATIDQVDHVQVVRALKVTDLRVHHDATMHVRQGAMMHAHHDAMIDQVVRAPRATDQVASGRVGLVRQMIAQHAEDQRVHVVIPTSPHAPKRQENVNR